MQNIREVTVLSRKKTSFTMAVCVWRGGISVCLLVWESYKYEETFGSSFYRRERAGLAQGHSVGEK